MHTSARSPLFSPLLRTLVIAGVFVACRAGEMLPPTAVASIEIDPGQLTIERGTSAPLAVRVLNAEGAEASGAVVRWSSRVPTIARVTSTGQVEAMRVGVVEILATVGDRSASVVVTVVDPAKDVPATFAIGRTRSFVWPGDSLALAVTSLNRWSEVIRTPSLQWTSSEPSVASVSADGVVRGVAPGEATITATAAGVTVSLPVIVDPPSAFELGSLGELIPGSESLVTLVWRREGSPYPVDVKWSSTSSSDPSVVTISSAGVVRGLRDGNAVVSASLNGLTVRADVRVRSLAGRIAFVRSAMVHTMTLDGTAPAAVTPRLGPAQSSPRAAISPDGNELAFECGADVCRAPLVPGGEVTRLLAEATSPSWSADGRSIAALDLPAAAFVIVPIGGGANVRISTPVYVPRSPAKLSPDGKRIGFDCWKRSVSPYYNDDLEYYSSDFRGLCTVGTDVASSESAIPFVDGGTAIAWSPDGARFVYTRDRQLRVASLSRPSDFRVVKSASAAGNMESAWSPDGRHLLVAEGADLWLVEVDGGQPVRLILPDGGGAQVGSPSWSAAGSQRP